MLTQFAGAIRELPSPRDSGRDLSRYTDFLSGDSRYWRPRGSYLDQESSFVWLQPRYADNITTAFVQTSSPRMIAVGSVRLDNPDSLRNSLGLASEVSDLQIVVEAYRHGRVDNFLNNVFGEFSVAIWDQQSHILVCCTDRLGIRPFYYRSCDLIRFASRPELLVYPDNINEVLEPSQLEEYLAGCECTRDPRSTCLRQIFRVRPGHLVLFENGKTWERRYWHPEHRTMRDFGSPSEYALAFKETLEEAVRCRLPRRGPIWFDASGGVDSTSVVYLAHSQLASSGELAYRTMYCRSIVPSATRELSERHFIEGALTPLHLTAEFETLEKLPLIPPLGKFSADSTCELALSSIALNETQRLCDRILTTGCRAHLTGHGADHLLGFPSLLYLRNLLRKGNIIRAYEDLRAWAVESGGSYANLIWNHIVFPNHLERSIFSHRGAPSWSQSSGPKISPWEEAPFPFDGISDIADRKWLRHLLNGAAILRAIASCSLQFGVEKCFPYFDARLIELLLSIPPEERSHPPLPKWLLREAMRGAIPESIRMKHYQPTGDAILIMRLQRDRRSLVHMIGNSVLAKFGLVNIRKLQIAFEVIIQGDSREIVPFIRFLTAEFWLRNLSSQRT